MIDKLIAYDEKLFLFLNNLGSSTWDPFWMFYTTKFYWIPFYGVLLFLFFKKYQRNAFFLTVVLIIAMVAFTDQVTNIFKDSFMRFRPCHNPDFIDVMRRVKSECGGLYGYFSGHASNSMAVAVFTGLTLKYKYKNLIFLLLFWAALMGYSRIYIGVHYPLDVLCGMTFGALSGFGFYKLQNYLHNRYKLL